MPDHFHLLIWWDTEEIKDLTISKIIQGVKSVSAKRIIDYLRVGASTCSHLPSGCYFLNKYVENPNKKIGIEHTRSKHKIWQKGFYDFNILSANKYQEKLNYIHNNPFKDERIANPEDYSYSSRLFYETGKGILTIDLL